MEFLLSNIYHIYNQGNNGETIFNSRSDYLKFLKKVRTLILPECEFLAYSLMPNHFHFLIMATERSSHPLSLGFLKSNQLSNALRLLLSQYTQDYNKLNDRSGSLFRQKTKAKNLTESGDNDGALSCFNYIHNNASAARLVNKSVEWEFCSLSDYLGLRNGTLCNKKLTMRLLGIDEDYIKEMAYTFKNNGSDLRS